MNAPTRNIVVTALIVAAANLVLMPFSNRLAGLSVDTLFWLRDKSFGPRYTPKTSPTVVIAINEETYRRPPFRNLPKVMWSSELAVVLNAVIDAGARVIGFDVIFPTSVEQELHGYDRDLLIALRNASRAGKVVLGKVQHQHKPISPFAGYSYAVGHNLNIRPLNMLEDDDGVIRRLPLFFRSADLERGERIETSMALEIASRYLGQKPTLKDRGDVFLGGKKLDYSGSGPLNNFDGGAGWIPSYSLADLYDCAKKGDKNYFRNHFSGKAVFLGAVLDVEDRKLTSRRFIGTPDIAEHPDRCVHAPMKGLYRTDIVRDSIPGVYVQASGVNMLVRNDFINELGMPGRMAVTLVLSCLTALSALMPPFLVAAFAVGAGTVAWVITPTILFQYNILLPFLQPIATSILAFGLITAYRFVVADKDKRYLRDAFSRYLPATVVDRLVESAAPPTLGGETRELTVLFSDIQDFTRISEKLTPTGLVRFLNRYHSVMTDVIEGHGGFVDKYIGDAVIGVFGAPIPDPDHARHAVQAAIACRQKLAEMQRSFDLPDDPPVITRIGINSGEMLVGNIGSSRRFNYTVMGDAVNLASRLEGANKVYGTTILVSETTRRQCHDQLGNDALAFREIDRVRVVGRETPVTVYEPLDVTMGQFDTDEYAAALAAYRRGEYADAARGFKSLSEAGDIVAERFYKRIQDLDIKAPPDWEGVTVLDIK